MVDLINQIDFKREREVIDNQSKLPQNIQAIKLFATKEYIIIEPNSKSLQIDTRLVINRATYQVSIEPLSALNPQDTPQLYSAFIGLIYIKSVPYIVLADKCTHHPLHPIYKDFFQIVSATLYPIDSKPTNQNNEQISSLRQLLSKGFYFTYEKCDDIDRSQFMWNSSLCKCLYEKNIKGWDVLVIQGFIDSFQTYLDGKRITVALIAKRSMLAPGTRIAQTGVTEQGSVANFVETEQIISVANIKCSVKQIRGSAPIFWREKNNLMRPLELYGSDKENQSALEKHFNRLIQQYERVIAINLMNKNKSKEHDIIAAYELGVQQMNSDRIKYIYLNFDDVTQGVDFQNINQHVKKLATVIKNLQFDAVDLKTKERYMKQKGIIRTNCMACLDRTNVYQMRVGLLHLDFQLKCMGVNLEKLCNQHPLDITDKDMMKSVNSIIILLRQLWADHGDQISYLYAGTGSIHSNIDKSGTSNFFAILGSGMVPLSRIYRNNFSENSRQESIQLLLGSDQSTKIEITDGDQLFLNFTNLDLSDLNKLGYANIFFKDYKLSQDGTKHLIFGVTREKNIQIQCYSLRIDKFLEDSEQQKSLERLIPNPLRIKRIESKHCFVFELGVLNLSQLLALKSEQSPFTEPELLQLLYDLATQVKQYSDRKLYLNGISIKGVWFTNRSVQLDTATHLPTDASNYPTIVKPNYFDPLLVQKIHQQEQAYEQQEDLHNTNDLLSLNNKVTEQDVEQCQVWILARIIYVALFYPQPEKSNSMEIMLPNLNGLIEMSKYVILCKLLKRMLRQDLLTSILSLNQLVQELSQLVPQQFARVQIADKPICEEKYGSEQLKAQLDLCKHFKAYEQGIKVVQGLKALQPDLPIEDEIQLEGDMIYFLVHLNRVEEAFLEMEKFLQLVQQCNDAEIMQQKSLIIETNLLILRMYTEFQVTNHQVLRELLQNQPPEKFAHPIASNVYFIWSQILTNEEQCLQYAQKALDFFKINKIQNEYCKAQILNQNIQLLAKKIGPQKALDFISFHLSQVRSECVEKIALLMAQARIEQETTQEKGRAQRLYEEALKVSLKVYRDENHRKVKELRELIHQL